MSHVSSYGSYGGQQSGQVRTHHHVSIDLFSTSRTCTNPAGLFLSDRGYGQGNGSSSYGGQSYSGYGQPGATQDGYAQPQPQSYEGYGAQESSG
ncbi:hypothetical protein E3U43_011094 [Larimichthys crocea]|uniref:Uncharacterized protein n=1 Tax=Larimichthys crocea TaxID=215358 RepID=A0ACD3QIF5_LARCR|nr:hypothetical protein E3U43_011094 [Larimichthys crocea]